MNLEQLRSLGFDESRHVPNTKQFKVRCSRCEPLVINGFPCHETNCPNAMHECNGCWTMIPANQRYCEDCLL